MDGSHAGQYMDKMKPKFTHVDAKKMLGDKTYKGFNATEVKAMDSSHVGKLWDKMKPPNANLDGTKMVNRTAEDYAGFNLTKRNPMFGKDNDPSSSLENIKPEGA